jgi:hypothetical protein
MGRGQDLAGWSVAACDIRTLSQRVLIAEQHQHPGNGVEHLKLQWKLSSSHKEHMKIGAYHFCIQKGIIIVCIGLEQLAPQMTRILDIPEQCHVDRKSLVVREREGAHNCHGREDRLRLADDVLVLVW